MMAATTSTSSTPSLTASTTEPPTLYERRKLSRDELNFNDDCVLALCILIVAITAIYAAAKVSREIRVFFLADRSFSFMPLAASIFMSSLGTANFVGVAGEASRSGLSVYAYELNGALALLFLGWIFLPIYIASGSITTVEYIRKRYGGARIEICLSAVFILLTIFNKISVELYSLYRLLEHVFSSIPWYVACPIPLIPAILITCSGGLKTLVFCNSVQAVILVFGAVCIGHYSLESFHDYDDLRDKYFEAWPNTSSLHFMQGNDSYKYTVCGIPNARAWNMFRPHYNLELPWPGMLFGITIDSLWYFCCNQTIVQSALGARNIVQAKYACLLCAYGKILTIVFLVLPGIVARILYTDTVACADPSVCEMVCGSPHGCSDMAFPLLFLDVVPQGYRGLVLAAVLSCGVSSLSASLNSGSTIFTLNVYRNFRPIMTETDLIMAIRTSVVVLGAAGLMVVPLVKLSPLLHDYILNIISSFAPPILAVFLCGLLWERACEESAFRSLLLGLLLAVLRLVWSLFYRREQCGDTPGQPAPQIISNFHFLHFSIFVFVLCTACCAAGSVFSEPINEVHMYRLLFWLRHSKKDRVDLDELDEAYQALQKEVKTTDPVSESQIDPKLETDALKDVKTEPPNTGVESLQTSTGPAQPKLNTNEDKDNLTVAPAKTRILSMNTIRACCVCKQGSDRLVTKNELRETVKQRADIHEIPVQESSLNLHALLLLLIIAGLWGFLA